MVMRKKTKKIAKGILISFGIIIALVVAFYFIFGLKQSYINGVDPEKVYVSVISDNTQSQTIQYTASGGQISENSQSNFAPDPSITSTFVLNEPQPIAQKGGNYGTGPNGNSGYLVNEGYSSLTATTTNVQITGLPLGSITNNLSAVCTLYPVNDNLHQMGCTFFGSITTESQPHLLISGITLIATPTFYLNGYLPPSQATNNTNQVNATQNQTQNISTTLNINQTIQSLTTNDSTISQTITDQGTLYTLTNSTTITTVASDSAGNVYVSFAPNNSKLIIISAAIGVLFVILIIVLILKSGKKGKKKSKKSRSHRR